MAAKTSWHSDIERNYVAVNACSDGVRRMQGRTPRWALRVSTACQYQYQYQCQYRVPGVNSDSLQMDVFRILRVAFLKSTSTGATALSPDYLPISYEIFGARSGGPRDPADRMRDTFAKVTTYLRTGGNLLNMQLAAALPFLYSYVWLMQLG